MHPEGPKPKRLDQKVKSEASTAGNSRTPAPPRRRAPGAGKEDWIAQHLQRVYDDALSEDIPQEMLDLLSAIDEGDSEKDSRG